MFRTRNLREVQTPNWCQCELTVTGPADKLKEFKHKLPQMDFDKIIPYPVIERPDNTTERLEYSSSKNMTNQEDGYHWSIKNWGCKWNVAGDGDTVPFQQVGKKLFCDFDTPWGPPEPIIHKLGELYPDLIFDLKYWEGGMGFKGRLKVQGSDVLINEQGDYSGNRGG